MPANQTNGPQDRETADQPLATQTPEEVILDSLPAIEGDRFPPYEETEHDKQVKVLLLDVELSPNIGYTWGKWDQNVIKFIKQRQIFCFAWGWLGSDVIDSLALPSFEMYRRFPESNKALLEKMHALYSEADVIIGHNLDKFDDKQANTDFILNGLLTPPPHKTIDTLKIARTKFRFNSNKLDDLCEMLGIGKKRKHDGFELWERCLNGDSAAWEEMMLYNKQDVVLLKGLYYKFRPWMTTHPDLNAKDGKDACPACKSMNLIRQGYRIVGGGKKPQFQCRDCGKWSRGKCNPDGQWKFS